MKNKVIKSLAGAMAVTMLVSGCGIQWQLKDDATEETSEESCEEISEESADEAATSDSSEDEDTKEAEKEDNTEDVDNAYVCNANPGEWESPELMEGEELTSDELENLREFFSQVDNYGFVDDPFKTVQDIKWGGVLNNEMAGLGYSGDCPQEAIDALNAERESKGMGSLIGYDGCYEGLYYTTGDNFRAFVEAKTGMTDIDVHEILGHYFYYEPYDVYLNCGDPFIYENEITCEKGVRKDNTIQVEISYSSNRYNKRVTLLETGDANNPYQFVSCRQLWEKDAVEVLIVNNKYSDETILCSARYNRGDEKPSVQLMNDYCSGEYRTISTEDNVYPSVTDVKEVALCDLDGDGLSDLIVTAVCNGETVPFVFKGNERVYDLYGDTYREFEYLSYKTDVTEWICDNVDKLNTDDIIDYIKDNAKEFEAFYN